MEINAGVFIKCAVYRGIYEKSFFAERYFSIYTAALAAEGRFIWKKEKSAA